MESVHLVELTQSDFAYSDEEQIVIEQAIKTATETHGGFLEYKWSDRLVRRGAQIFAVFPWEAREALFGIFEGDADYKFEIKPIVVKGRMLIELPDEGRVGLAHLFRKLHANGNRGPWRVHFTDNGWLRVDELGLSNDEIIKNISDEIEAGGNPLTGGRILK